MDLASLETLKARVEILLERYNNLKQERDKLTERVGFLEREVESLRNHQESLQNQLNETLSRALSPQDQTRIENIVSELLSKLEGF